MRFEGGCYCGAVRYVAEGEPMMKAQCHCRECQYFAGGSPNVLVGMPLDGFAYTQGEPKAFTRGDLARPATREFCPTCGVHILTRARGFRGVIIKVGTLDDPSLYDGPAMAVQTADKQSFHRIPDGIPTFERFAG
jgi:hypothetical protein